MKKLHKFKLYSFIVSTLPFLVFLFAVLINASALHARDTPFATDGYVTATGWRLPQGNIRGYNIYISRHLEEGFIKVNSELIRKKKRFRI